jgi:hypothetical protein
MRVEHLIAGLTDKECAELLFAIANKISNGKVLFGVAEIMTTKYIATLPATNANEDSLILGSEVLAPNKINAIRAYRDRNPIIGLIDAKDKIDLRADELRKSNGT